MVDMHMTRSWCHGSQCGVKAAVPWEHCSAHALMDADVIYLCSVGGGAVGGCGVRSEDDRKRSVRHNNQISGRCPHYDVGT